MTRNEINALATPLTDAAVGTDDYGVEEVHPDFCRALERKLAALKIAVQTPMSQVASTAEYWRNIQETLDALEDGNG